MTHEVTQLKIEKDRNNLRKKKTGILKVQRHVTECSLYLRHSAPVLC